MVPNDSVRARAREVVELIADANSLLALLVASKSRRISAACLRLPVRAPRPYRRFSSKCASRSCSHDSDAVFDAPRAHFGVVVGKSWIATGGDITDKRQDLLGREGPDLLNLRPTWGLAGLELKSSSKLG
jgi:hypothetical protein